MKIICIGRNYSDHINELGNTRPSYPVVFLKPDSSIIAKNQNFIIPAFSNEIHHEVELVIKINKVGKHIDQSFANKYYNEIGLVQLISLLPTSYPGHNILSEDFVSIS